VAGKLALLLASTVLSVALFEGVVRLVIRPSSMSYGTLLGRELPPVRVVPPPQSGSPPRDTRDDATAKQPTDVRDPAASEDDTTPVSSADLQGLFREDRLLGYAPLERATSPHGWWMWNNIGARATTDTTPQQSPGKPRVLIFGESYASGSRVRQKDAWPTVLGATTGADVVNLAVDGYSMGQALLRFREVTRSIDYAVAMLVFSPTADLWRDVNTIRSLAHRSWNSDTVMPRFVVQDGRLVLVRGPYEVPSDVYVENAGGLREPLRRHLHAYDRFYFAARHEIPPLIGDLVLWKIAATLYATSERAALLRRLRVEHIDLDSEAMQMSRKIFETMRDEVQAHGRRFMLVFLPEPHDVRRIRHDPRNWRQVMDRLCAGLDCIDLAPALTRVPAEEIDRGHDGTHYGPKMNRLVATELERGGRLRQP
jgi:hypothetical protein